MARLTVRLTARPSARLTAKRLLIAAVVSAVYPTCVLGYVWTHCFQSDLAGGKNGPLDAYRHTLASATVAYTLSPAAVDWVTAAFEDQATPAGSMDAHNNAIGAALGARAAHFGDIAAMVSQQVENGAENTAIATQTTWLAKRQWDERWLGKAF